MQTLAQIKSLLVERGLAPRKSLGQNFLIDHNLIRKLVDAAGVEADDVVLEIGPGTGALTGELLSRGANVIACELDRGLAGLLREMFAGAMENGESQGTHAQSQSTHPNPSHREGLRSARFTLIEGDCLERAKKLNHEARAALAGKPFKLVANLPYGAGTPVIVALLIEHPECSAMHVTIQKEVAERLAAAPGTSDYGLLSVVAQAAATIDTIASLPPECFWPRPDVTSRMVSITRRKKPLTDDLAGLAAFCQRVFGQRRKQLGTILGRELSWPAGVEPTMRAEQVPVDKMIELAARAGTQSNQSAPEKRREE